MPVISTMHGCELACLVAMRCPEQVLVVKSYEAITRLRASAQQAKVPIPAMLADSLIQVSSRPPPTGMGPACRQTLHEIVHATHRTRLADRALDVMCFATKKSKALQCLFVCAELARLNTPLSAVCLNV